jgi:hypothetical protein
MVDKNVENYRIRELRTSALDKSAEKRPIECRSTAIPSVSPTASNAPIGGSGTCPPAAIKLTLPGRTKGGQVFRAPSSHRYRTEMRHVSGNRFASINKSRSHDYQIRVSFGFSAITGLGPQFSSAVEHFRRNWEIINVPAQLLTSGKFCRRLSPSEPWMDSKWVKAEMANRPCDWRYASEWSVTVWFQMWIQVAIDVQTFVTSGNRETG